jgi:biotin transport system ATP-binding protein
MPILETRGLVHRFPGGCTALKGIDLRISAGEFVTIVGRNGSGKTVLVRHFNGLLAPTSGEVLYESAPVRGNLHTVRQRVGMVFQNADTQIVGETVWEDTAFGPENLRLPRAEIDARVESALTAVGLIHLRGKRPHTLSGGERKKLAIAGVLAMDPRVIVFDEPFSGLDYPGVRMVLAEILRLHEVGHTVILVTHEVEKSLSHATRLLVMHEGAVVRDGKPAALRGEIEEFGVRMGPDSRERIGSMTWLR